MVCRGYCAVQSCCFQSHFARWFSILSQFYYLEVKLNTFTENTNNLKIGNLIFGVHESSAIFLDRKEFIYLLEIFYRVAFSIFGEMILKMSPEGRIHFIYEKAFQKMFLDPSLLQNLRKINNIIM